jgi:hypothetical protein
MVTTPSNSNNLEKAVIMFAANKTDLPPESWEIDLEEVRSFTDSKGKMIN